MRQVTAILANEGSSSSEVMAALAKAAYLLRSGAGKADRFGQTKHQRECEAALRLLLSCLPVTLIKQRHQTQALVEEFVLGALRPQGATRVLPQDLDLRVWAPLKWVLRYSQALDPDVARDSLSFNTALDFWEAFLSGGVLGILPWLLTEPHGKVPSGFVEFIDEVCAWVVSLRDASADEKLLWRTRIYGGPRTLAVVEERFWEMVESKKPSGVLISPDNDRYLADLVAFMLGRPTTDFSYTLVVLYLALRARLGGFDWGNLSWIAEAFVPPTGLISRARVSFKC